MLRDSRFEMIGFTIIEDNCVAGYDRHNNLVGRYYLDRNRTYNESGDFIGNGEQLELLMHKSNGELKLASPNVFTNKKCIVPPKTKVPLLFLQESPSGSDPVMCQRKHPRKNDSITHHN